MTKAVKAVFAPSIGGSDLIGMVRLSLLHKRTIKEVNAVHRQVLKRLVPGTARRGLRILRPQYVGPVVVALKPYILNGDDGPLDLPVGGSCSLVRAQCLPHSHIYLHESNVSLGPENCLSDLELDSEVDEP